MRKLISAFMVLAFVMTMIPAHSHAMMHNNGSTKAEYSEHADCHHHGEVKTASNKHGTPSNKPCCEKGMCKCATGSCNGGLAKILSNGDTTLLRIASSQSQFDFSGQHLNSALPEGLKRPPKA